MPATSVVQTLDSSYGSTEDSGLGAKGSALPILLLDGCIQYAHEHCDRRNRREGWDVLRPSCSSAHASKAE